MLSRAIYGWFWPVLALLFISAGAHAQERAAGEIDLRPKFEKGQQIRYQLELKSSTKNESADKRGPKKTPPRPNQDRLPTEEGLPVLELGVLPERSESTATMILNMKVADVSPEKVATVDVVFESMKFRTLVGEEAFEFDSAAQQKPGEEDVIAMLLKPIVGTTITLTVDRNGNITKVTGGEALSTFGQIVSGGSSGGSPSAAGAGGGGASQLFGPIFTAHPSKGTAKIGESWEYSDGLQTSLLGDMKMTTRHTLRGLQGRDALVAISGRIEPRSEEPGGGGFQVQNSSYSGTYVWDTAEGQLSKMDTSMSVRMTGDLGDQKMDSRNEARVSIKRLRGRP